MPDVRTTETVVPGLGYRGSIGHFVTWLRGTDNRRAMTLARRGLVLPRGKGIRSRGVWAVTMVKDEEDIICESVSHLLAQGVDRVLVADNGSSDSTVEALRSMREPRLLLAKDTEFGYFQSAKMSILGWFAGLHGAEWVVPFDADEFWTAPNQSLAGYLSACPTPIARAEMHNCFPGRVDGEWLLEVEPHALRKVAYRPHPLALLETGNHRVSRPGAITTGLRVIHVPWRSEEQLVRKLRQGAAAAAKLGGPTNVAGHWREHGARDDDELHDLWEDIRSGRPRTGHGWWPSGGHVVRIRGRTFAQWPPAPLDQD